MSLQSDFAAAGEEYGRRITERQEADRLAALAIEARREGNAAAFAAAITEALSDTTDSDTETEEDNS